MEKRALSRPTSKELLINNITLCLWVDNSMMNLFALYAVINKSTVDFKGA